MMAIANRTVSFVEHLELDLDGGKVLPHALCFGDVDNNGCNELVVGTTGGHLHIFRGNSETPWCKLSDLGEITCICIGDVLNLGRNQLVVLNMGGTCFVYAFSSKQSESEKETLKVGEAGNVNGKSQLMHKQFIQTNTKIALIKDVDGNGIDEMLLCHTDRTVTACRWSKSSEMFVSLQNWQLRQSIGGITFHGTDNEGLPQILATQPGCTCAILHPLWMAENTAPVGCDNDAAVSYNLMSSLSRSQNPGISCTIVGNISKASDSLRGYFALCTLDGTIKLIEDDQVLWSIQVGHQLFAMNKLDVLGNGKEEVIVCAWNGLTYIVDHDRNVVKFPYEENVQAFCAGQYAIEDENIASMVYANFRDKLCLYYDIRLPQLRMPNFLTECESSDEIMSLMTEFGADTEEDRKSLVRYCMYGIQCGTDDEALSGDKIELFKRKSNET